MITSTRKNTDNTSTNRTTITGEEKVGKVIHWKFDHANKWYMHNPTLVLENDTHKLIRDFDIQMDLLIKARRPDLIIINKKSTCKRLCEEL